MRVLSLVAIAAALVLPIAIAPAQVTMGTRNGKLWMSFPGSPDADYLGFGWGGARERGPDGKMRWADFPSVSSVAPGSPADSAGLRVGDRIVSVDGVDGRESGALGARKPGSLYVFRVLRGTEELEVRLVSGKQKPR